MLSDTLTIGLVLILLIGSIALYLYTRIQQSEQKISLLESILLDLKMSSEVSAYSELPAHEMDSYVPYSETDTKEVEEYKSVVADVTLESVPEHKNDTKYEAMGNAMDNAINYEPMNNTMNNAMNNGPVNYENMTVKELTSLAKSKGITGITKKSQLIEALRTETSPEVEEI